MPTITTVDAAWLPSPATFDDAEARRFDTAMFLGDGSANGVRGGIVRHGDNSLAVAINGSDQLTIQPGAFVIPAATGLGVYRGALQTALGPGAGTALTSRNGTNPRIDLIVIQATSTGAVVKTIDGTPSSSPSAPALPAQHIEIARATVPQLGGGAVTIDSTWRQYATAIGGIITAETPLRLPTSGVQRSQRAITLDTGQGYVWDPTTSKWRPDINPGQYTEIGVTILPESGAFSNATATCRYAVIGRTFFGEFTANVILAGTANNAIRLGMPPGLLARTGGPVGKGSGVEVGATNWLVSARLTDASTISVYKYDGTTVIGSGRRVDLNVVLELA